MGCGCGKPVRNATRNGVIGPRPAERQPRVHVNFTAQSISTVTPNTAGASPVGEGMDTERLRVERLRRDAIKRALNK